MKFNDGFQTDQKTAVGDGPSEQDGGAVKTVPRFRSISDYRRHLTPTGGPPSHSWRPDRRSSGGRNRDKSNGKEMDTREEEEEEEEDKRERKVENCEKEDEVEKLQEKR
ncbi:hypothetical protein E2C01_016844 [Portunus trituberculatus]|uniref:Uncharacterized protein n=1 Tax=Portunus trituberculatus TaxID=210409 RepID=A0A5B7DQ62_PORTR|nr:hypothetical protein [Portunus trituberculatus]